MKKWSDGAWEAAAGIYEQILRHPFVTGLADGTLPHDRFMHYLRQDALYLDNYTKVLSHIAARLYDRDDTARFIKFAQDGIAVEQAMHEVFLNGLRPAASEMSPACLLYTSVLSSQATAPVEVETAAVLPCFWVYQKVGRAITARSSADNPYRQWIDTYSDPVFEESTRLAIDTCDRLAAGAGDIIRRRMTDIFALCTRMEWMFWDSAWNLEKWKI